MSNVHYFILNYPIYVIIYLLIGSVLGLSITIYKTAEAYQQDTLGEPESFLDILGFPLFFTLLYPLFFLLRISFYIFINVSVFIDRFSRGKSSGPGDGSLYHYF
jgi:hypothetical protein